MNRREVSLSDDCPKHVWVAEGAYLNKLCMLTNIASLGVAKNLDIESFSISLCSAASQLRDEALREMQRSMLARPQ